MNHTVKVGFLFMAVTFGLYFVIVNTLVKSIDALNTAREDQLNAATIQHELLRRVPKNRIDSVLIDINE
ncbi:MAG: hypothetical protein A2293_03680 [Elusimicrobia bacterium RIFOXYB2_FULL_49_7]|nr:MAG: hypothetical protein A2293_03680 [Elusimicrobia bacterium RIFOXYB2_FULL_49_7]